MLTEIVVRDLGVIEHAEVVLGPRMTALTGETGAGKTMIVGALSLLLGGRSDPAMVRLGATEARVDGRFEHDGTETVLSRVVSSGGRSRSYVDGHPVTVAQLNEIGARLVDVTAQHSQQTLTAPAAQRAALDAFGRVDTTALDGARVALAQLDAGLAALGGDERARHRELELLRYQHAELTEAALDDPSEPARLAAEEELLADAGEHQRCGAAAIEAIRGESGATETLAQAAAALHRRAPFIAFEERLRSIQADLDDAADELRRAVERIEDDPARLASVRARRQRLRELQRKYGDTIDAMRSERDSLAARIDELERHEQRAAELEHDRTRVLTELRRAAATVRSSRIAAAAPLAAAVEARLRTLSMPKARLSVEIGGGEDSGGSDDGSDVRFLLAANPGSVLLPLAKVASGGELARSMLALRLALLEARVELGGLPDTLVFDEVDAGIGGAAALAVGRALAELAVDGQVLVVTHLAQVAAQADHHVAVEKTQSDQRTTTQVTVLDHSGRVREVARMLGGDAESPAGRRHAEELLGTARTRPRTRTRETALDSALDTASDARVGRGPGDEEPDVSPTAVRRRRRG